MTAKRGASRSALPRQHFPREVEDDFENRIGERGQMVGKALHREQAREVLRQQAEHLRLVRLAQDVHLPLGVPVGRAQL